MTFARIPPEPIRRSDPGSAAADPAGPIRLEGLRARALDAARSRLLVVGLMFTMAFLVIVGRLVEVTADGLAAIPGDGHADTAGVVRADILDRNGLLLATSLPSAALYADPARIMDVDEVVEKLTRVLPDLDRAALETDLRGSGRFVYIKRHLTPAEQFAVNELGLPGLGFEAGERRVYPQGPLAVHVLGFCDVDGRGLAGVERHFEAALAGGKPVTLSLDLRAQSVVREELAAAMATFRAIGAAGLVLDARSGEVLAMVSLPDYDPNSFAAAEAEARFNRVTQAAYELGSGFKVLTAAMALDSGLVSLESGYDASRPLRVAGFRIGDYRPKNRWLSVPEILVYSSNIGAAQMARDVGADLQQQYLRAMGLLSPASIELPEVARPLLPDPWRDVSTMTIGFGHGLAVSPLQLAAAVAAVANGGLFHDPTVIRRDRAADEGRRVIAAETSEQVRALMRLVVLRGSGRQADVPGLRIGGKTGTAEKNVAGRYRRDRRISSFVATFPIDAPRYIVLALLDEPKGTAATHNFATGGWVAAPLVGRIAARLAPLLGVMPVASDLAEAGSRDRAGSRERPILVSMQRAVRDTRGQPLDPD